MMYSRIVQGGQAHKRPGSVARAACGLGLLGALATLSAPALGDTISPREIAARVTPATVSIASFDRWGDRSGTGTGFLVDNRGTFVTNHHVLDGAASLKVELSTGEQFTQVYSLVTDSQRDIAILRIPAEDTPAVAIGSDRDLEVGDTVFVMGNPLGFDRTFSNGMVSAKRLVEGSEVIQVTAPISPGSSGGPVMNEKGEVIGIATWLVEGGQNINMAIPVRYLRPMLAMDHTPVPYEGKDADLTRLVAREVDALSRRRATRIDPKGSDQYESEVLAQLVIIESIALDNQLARSHEPVTGELDDWQNGLVSVTLQGATTYSISGVCDSDCDDLDLFLYGTGDKLLADDQEVDDTPLLEYRPRDTIQATLRVRMASCLAEPCRFGVAVFRQK